jgi:putative DNA primase/helicase
MNFNHNNGNKYEQEELSSTDLLCPACQQRHSEDSECPSERTRYIELLQSSLPKELLEYSQFVCFKLFPGSPKQKKPPFNPHTGELASPTDQKTWSSFAQAAHAFLTNPEYAGIGFVFTKDDPFTGIDLDSCLDPNTGEIAFWANTIVQKLASLTEISISGLGLHILIKAKKPGPHCKQGGVEIYDQTRFFTLTGQLLPNTQKEILPRQQELDTLYHQVFASKIATNTEKNTEKNKTNTGGGSCATLVASPTMTDEQVLELIRKAKNSAKFEKLWTGDSSEYFSHSEADLALLGRLAFYTQNREQLDRLFRRSSLYRTEVWDELHGEMTYGERTISRALAGLKITYTKSGPTVVTTEGFSLKPNLALPLIIRFTDLGNANLFAQLWGENVRYVTTWNKWLVWDGSCWQVDELGLVDRLVRETTRLLHAEAERQGDSDRSQAIRKWAIKSESRDKLAGMQALARFALPVPITHRQLDSNPWLLNCKNGTINLKTGQLLPHNRDNLITKQIDIAFDSSAEAPYWQDALLKFQDGKPEMVRFLKRAVGYSITGDIATEVLFFLYGGGANGKSTFSETMAMLLGPYFQKAPAALLMAKDKQNQGGPSPEIARLFGTRFVIAAEIGEGQRLNEGQVKDLTGNDTLVARYLHQEYFEFRPTHKLWMYGNHKPIIRGTDEGIWRRIKLVPFIVQIPEFERIEHFKEKYLFLELPGILRWAVDGCLDWQHHGLLFPEQVKQATQGYRAEMDVIAAFLEECCVIGPQFQVRASELYDAYKEWCDKGNEYKLPQRTFGTRLTERGFERYVSTNGHVRYRGIGLKQPLDATTT